VRLLAPIWILWELFFLDKMPDFVFKNPKKFPPAAGWGVRLLTPLKNFRLRRAEGGALINIHRKFSELGRVRLLRGGVY